MAGSPFSLPPRRARLAVAALAFLAYLPSLAGGFTYDDHRFVEKNPAVHELSLRNAARYFTDPATLASVGTEGIYRPLRTLDFAIDWAISGGRPWFFHLRNLLYHVAAALLVFSLIRRLLPDRPGAAAAGALVFALHPVNTEAVAWITSRGDVMVLVLLLLALLLHLDGRRLPALGVLVLALLAKEEAVVFPALAWLSDRFRGRAAAGGDAAGDPRARRRWIGIYAGVVLAYVALWYLFIAGGRPGGFGHLPHFWGGSYGANLLTMSKGFLLYVHRIVFPVSLVVDYHVPATPALDPGAAVSLVVLLLLALACRAGGRPTRFMALWFLAALLPASNLVRPIGIPTAERFLYVPLVGVAVAGGCLLSRSRLSWAVLACFLVLTFARCFDWRSDGALWAATARVARTPRSLAFEAAEELDRAWEAHRAAKKVLPTERAALLAERDRHADAAVRKAEELVALYRDVIRLTPGELGSTTLAKAANARLLQRRPEAALRLADRAIRILGTAIAYYNAALALEELAAKERDRKRVLVRLEEALLNARRALDLGWDREVPDLPRRIIDLEERIEALRK